MGQDGRLAARYLDDIRIENPSPAMAKARRDLTNYVGPATLKAAMLRYRRRGNRRRADERPRPVHLQAGPARL